jgi:hypothetical protein
VEKRLFLRRIASQRRNVIRGHAQMTVLVEADFADPSLAGFDEASMTTRITLQCSCIEVFGQLGRALGGHRIEHGREWG